MLKIFKFTILIIPINGNVYLDLRFEDKNLSLLIETKSNNKQFKEKDIKQILEYIKLERQYRPSNNIFAILYDTKTEIIKCWKNEEEISNEITIN